GVHAALGAVALGADMVEKHFTLSKRVKTPDSFFSADPVQFKQLVQSIRVMESSFGKVIYGPSKDEKKNMAFRRSLFAVKDIKKGETFTETNVRSIRPGHGIAPKYYNEILGKTAKRKIERGTPLTCGMVDAENIFRNNSENIKCFLSKEEQDTNSD
ncbi:MAG: N-acetylneuraminate synthase family protein, partial [Candidatus Omnitrophota bacterium]